MDELGILLFTTKFCHLKLGLVYSTCEVLYNSDIQNKQNISGQTAFSIIKFLGNNIEKILNRIFAIALFSKLKLFIPIF